jgi:hypothetical protein
VIGADIGWRGAGALAIGPERRRGGRNHNHQAAPGRDPQGLRPGHGYGDEVNDHTAPPGLIPGGAGEPDNPRRGCIDDPRGR